VKIMDARELNLLGEPDLAIAGLHIWIHGRQYPDSSDFDDMNWLRVTAYCIYPNAMVRTHGSIIQLSELSTLLKECEHLYKTLQGKAELRCLEPNLGVELVSETLGHIKVLLSITPDNHTESHRFFDGIDQSYLPPLIASIRTILKRFEFTR